MTDDAERNRLKQLELEIASNGRKPESGRHAETRGATADPTGDRDIGETPARESFGDWRESRDSIGDDLTDGSGANGSGEGASRQDGDSGQSDRRATRADRPTPRRNRSTLESREQPTLTFAEPPASVPEAPAKKPRRPRSQLIDSAINTASNLVGGPGAKPRKVKAPLSASEATKLRQPLIDAMRRYADYMDQIIYATVKGHEFKAIWSNVGQEELELLADAWLTAGSNSGGAAQRVRTTVAFSENFVTPAMITVPRMIKTIRWYRECGGISLS